MSQTENISLLMAADRLDEALAAADTAIASERGASAHLLFLRGKILWRLGRRSEAVSCYTAAADIDPGSPAARALELARDIDSFFNPDMFNP